MKSSTVKKLVVSTKSNAKTVAKPAKSSPAVNTYNHDPKSSDDVVESSHPGRSNAEQNADDAAAAKAGSKKPSKYRSSRVKAQDGLTFMISRCTAILARVKGWSPALETATQNAIGELTIASEALRTLPATFSPTGSAVKAALQVGSIVSIREKVAKTYEDVIEDALELTGLTVLKVGDKHVTLKTTSGASIIVPRKHVELLSMDHASLSKVSA